MYVMTTLNCSRTTSETDHDVDTRSGEATCVCGAVTIVDLPELLELLED